MVYLVDSLHKFQIVIRSWNLYYFDIGCVIMNNCLRTRLIEFYLATIFFGIEIKSSVTWQLPTDFLSTKEIDMVL